ncbi:MAG: Orange carotenoid protein [Lyngbya sp. HA4199-MV5]|jgi:hypothetical protein|nr:Orange carotenoid protein [Lyngbya sp. HA4199-MV5]
MTAYTNQVAKHAESFKHLTVDDQLAVLWDVYGFIRNESGMEDPNGTAPDNSDALFNKTKGLSQDEQLQLMRDLLQGSNTGIGGEYNTLTNNTKLAFWYQLAQGMERSEVIQAPADYQPSSEAQSLVSVLEPIGFEQQFVFLRDALLADGGKPSVM